MRAPPPSPAPRPRTVVVGLLGGVASGKSAAAAALAGPDGVVLDADRLARAVLASPEVAARVAAELGPGLLGPDGAPDRARLAERVFGDPAALARLEGWIHPRVRAMIRERLAEARAGGAPLVVLDVPLLLEHAAEHGLDAECDALVFVDAPAPDREARAAAARGWAAGEVARREAHQLDLDAKRRRATHVLDNSGPPRALAAAAAELRRALLTAPRSNPA